MLSEDAALVAAQTSWKCAMSADKDGWLGLMADDICIEDPIGVAPTNPTGEGVQGKEAVSAFFDQNIAKNRLDITTHESFYAGRESAHKLTIAVELENGVKTSVTSIFTYRLNEEGLLTNLRGYWKLSDMTFIQPD